MLSGSKCPPLSWILLCPNLSLWVSLAVLSLGCPDLPVCSPVRESLQHPPFFVQPSPHVHPCVASDTRAYLCASSWQAHECLCTGHGMAQCPMSLHCLTLDCHDRQAWCPKSQCPHNTCTSTQRRITLPQCLGGEFAQRPSCWHVSHRHSCSPLKAVKTTTPAPLALPSILDSSPPTPPFPLAWQ